MGQSKFRTRLHRTRRDGWTPERQLAFLDALARTRSVAAAARVAGMSRESAYRLRERSGGALFAAIWDRALLAGPSVKGHSSPLSDGRLLRTLGTHFRRERGDFTALAESRRQSSRVDRT